MKSRIIAIFCAFFSLALAAPVQAATVKGSIGQVLTTSSTAAVNGATITVNGIGFDETVGIYLGFCVIPKKGLAPGPCGGGVNKLGTSDASYWISSNPPPYGIGLADEFIPGGRFTKKLKIQAKIGKFDCRKVRCAITVRADHLRGQDRSYDLFIPVKVK